MDEDSKFEGVEEGYTIEKSLIIEAWARYRPVQSENDKKNKKQRPKARKVKDLKTCFGQDFINKLVANVRLKVYDYTQSEE